MLKMPKHFIGITHALSAIIKQPSLSSLSLDLSFTYLANIEQNFHNLFTHSIMLNIALTTSNSCLSLNSHLLNELVVFSFIPLTSKNRPTCMRSKSKEHFKKTTHPHYSLTSPPMNHCLIMHIIWAFHHDFLRFNRSTSNLLPVQFSMHDQCHNTCPGFEY